MIIAVFVCVCKRHSAAQHSTTILIPIHQAAKPKRTTRVVLRQGARWVLGEKSWGQWPQRSSLNVLGALAKPQSTA